MLNKPRNNLFEEIQESANQEGTNLFKFSTTVVAGTFDHLHSGHKLLLTQTALLTKKLIKLGVTSNALLANKANYDLIEPFEKRC